MNNSFPQVPILFYDFESNLNRNIFENKMEQSINSGSGPIVRVGSGVIDSGYGNDGRGRSLWGINWQDIKTDPGVGATEYYQFSVNTKGFKGIIVRFRCKAPYSYSPGFVGCNFSLNGTTYKTAGSNTTGAPSSNWSDAAIELFKFPEVNNNPNLILRIYAYKGLSSYSYGLLAIDNLTVTADTIISGAGEIALLNETDFYNSYYSGGTGNPSFYWKKSLIINGPGTVVTLLSPQNFSQTCILNIGCSLQCGIYPVWGTGSFTLNDGGALYSGDPNGILSGTDSVGNICVKGTRNYSSGADYYYNGTAPQVSGNGLPSSINVLGINNNFGVSLSNSVRVLDTMKLQAGNLILGNNDLIINDAAIVIGGSALSFVVTDNSGGMVYNKMAQKIDVNFPVGTLNSYNPALINYTGISDTFKVKVKGTLDHSPINPDKVINRQWIISENTSGGSDATVKLQWIQGQEAQGFNINSDIMVGRWDGTSWNTSHAVISGAGTPEDPYIASASGFKAFSCFGIGNDGALPVELTHFDYNIIGKEVRLNWETATEKNSNNFDIERKELNTNIWEHRGSIKANFVSNSIKFYSFSETNLVPGKYFYRLRMNDNDGTFQYSKIVEAEIKAPARSTLLQNFPNPFNPSTCISFELHTDAHVLLEVFDVKGEKVSCLVNEFRKAGAYEAKFIPSEYRSNLTSGIYFCRISTITLNGSKFSMVKKMLFMK